MNKRLALLAGGLGVTLTALLLTLYARPGAASAPAVREKEKKADPAAPRLATSRIVQVTIYPDSALVTREVEVSAGAGLCELVVSPLPEATVNTSLYSESSDDIRVLTTRFRTRAVKEDTREEVRKLEDEAKKLQHTAQKIQADIDAHKANVALLGKLEKFTEASTTHATEKGKLDSDTAITLAKYLMEGRLEKARELVTLTQQLEANAEQLSFVQRKRAELASGHSRTERDAVLVVDKANGAVGKVRLNYLVGGAFWRPQYKFRAGETAKDAVGLEYLAAVRQHTGEDWRNVRVTLSTAQPMLNAAPPDLQTLALAVVPRGAAVPGATLPTLPPLPPVAAGGGRPGMPSSQPAIQFAPGGGWGGMGRTTIMNQPVPTGPIANPMGNLSAYQLNAAAQQLRWRAQQELNRNKDATANTINNYAAALEQACELVVLKEGKRAETVARAGKNEGPSVTYHLPTRLSVPSRPDEQVIEVAKLQMEPDYFYKAIPVLTPHVYRQADLLNKSKYVLLPGEATMYQGSDFVGRMNLPLVAIGERFTVGFGVEPQLQVQRQMLDKSRTMQGGNQVLKFEYRILVSSYKPEKVRVQVWDRLPHCENESLGVTLVRATPEVCKDPVYQREERSTNLLRWDLEVEPQMRGEKAQKIQYEFKLELAKEATIGSFQSK
jgi:hypothetical protein